MLLIVLSTLAAMCLCSVKRQSRAGVPRRLLLGTIYIFGSWKTAILLHDSVRRPHSAFRRPSLVDVRLDGELDRRYRRLLCRENFGRHKLAPSVSPGKSWEGAAASAVTGVAFGMIYLPLTIKGTSLVAAGLMALAANVAGQVGDLAESADQARRGR